MPERSLFDLVPEPERRELLAASRRRRFARNEVIFHEGDPGNSLFVIERGRIGIRVTTPLGDVATLGVFGEGDAFGEGALLADDATRTATAVALEASETRSLSREQFDELRERHPAVEQLLIGALAEQVGRLTARLLEALYVPADQRVIRRIAELAAMYGGDEATIPLTQEDIATMAGTTRPTVNRVIKKAEERGVLRIGRGRVDVVDAEALRREAR
jgi:CRP-like cAMP-binding protein